MLGQKSGKVKRVSSGSTARSVASTERTAGSAQPAPEARLGNNTKSHAAFRESICPESGEIIGFALNSTRSEYVENVDSDTAKKSARQDRFQHQTTATKLLFNHQTPRGTQWRVTGCARRRISDYVAVLFSDSIKKAHFSGLMVCGSVWTCPPCAAKISERRKNEISAATDLHVESGGAIYMITRTFAHKRFDVLADMLVAQRKARDWMRKHRGYVNLMEEIDSVGHVRALETTYSDANHWHPHDHELLLTAAPLTVRLMKKIQSVQFELWRKACIKFGLGIPNRKRGVDVRLALSAAQYLAKFGREEKWGVASELSKQISKKGGKESLTPFDILRGYESGEKRFGPLFIEYANAFFGSRQIVWSKGLKKILCIDEKTDEELAKEESEDAVIIIKIDAFEWRTILKQPRDVRSLLLDLAETGGFDAVRLYLDKITFNEVPF